MALHVSNSTKAQIAEIDRQIRSLTDLIQDLDRYIANNRYTPEDVRDAEHERDAMETNLQRLMDQKKRLLDPSPAKPATPTVVRPYTATPTVQIPRVQEQSLFDSPAPDNDTTATNDQAQLAQLRATYKRLDDKLSRLDERIFACEVNMDPCCRTQDLSRQAAMDKLDYQRECSEITKQMNAIAASIRELEARQH